ncbi:LysR family transcriptional regulator [Sedimentitalea sp. CY04]|uniref:LysR family transcriptional regulator n=1 Tax=Parasedimentitalea denitrificans TaxID=2211118 RepID=A0ABX0W9S7_9RHOB|nr:LysR family transcriptional regulator [Sedimentitalea sp. CY04]NIZ62377.1 LysR family transcriptional regulator [Sedimentitalea sp. CY04]
MPSLPQIRYLYVVHEIYRHRRISAAADIVHVSQPAATQSLARVEEALGEKLFNRQPKGMLPTKVGELFEGRLARILEHLRRGESLARKKAARKSNQTSRQAFHKFCSPVQLRALIAIEKTGSFSQAATELGVSQPGVHRAIRELASLSGLPLLDQTRGGVELTAPAEVFAHQVRLAMSEFQQAIFEINEHLGRDVTRINLGSLPLSRTTVLPAAIDELLSQAGVSVQINCVDARYHALLRDLRFGDLDFLLGALRHPQPANDVVQEELFVDRLAVVVGPDHPLIKKKDVTLEDTLSFPWIAPPKETPSGAYLSDRLRIQDMPQTPVRIVSSSMGLLRGLLLRGDYISIASKRQIEIEEQHSTLVQLPIDLPESERAIGLTFRAGWAPTPVQQRFIEIIRSTAANE